MIADYADKLNTYEEFKDYADMVQQFIKKQKEENLPEGRYDLKNGIFCLGSEIYHEVPGWCTDGIP